MSPRVVIIGGGHNGLAAAAILARAGVETTLLERAADLGGATQSIAPWPGVDARLSRYSYLVSLLPRELLDELGIELELARRESSSFTPVPGASTGLLISAVDPDVTRASLARIGAAHDDAGLHEIADITAQFARAIAPTLLGPLPREHEIRALIDTEAWSSIVERPIGDLIRDRLADDLVRGVVATDALIGTFASVDDTSLAQNRCFLYHVIGGGTGDWDVPVGGMGRVAEGLAHVARDAGATLLTDAEVTGITHDGEVAYRHDGVDRVVQPDLVLAAVAPWVLAGLTGAAAPKPEGAQVKVNMLLTRLPKLKDPTVDSTAAFGGTFHINETLTGLERAFHQASDGTLPDPLPCEIYCHSLSDPSILGPELQAAGAQTLTVFALHAPDRLLDDRDYDRARAEYQQRVLDSLNSVLAEPIEPLLWRDADGNPCIETKTTRDLESALAMPGGNIFHGALGWPWAPDDAALDTPQERWGVQTDHDRILMAGSGSQRGGAVSALGGYSAARAALELLGESETNPA